MPPVRHLAATAVIAAAVVAPPALAGPASAPTLPAGFWIAGDLHVHTIYGHDTCTTPTKAWDENSTDRSARVPCEDPYVVGFTPKQRLMDANARGLDFVALTDHNNVVNQTDPDELAWRAAHPGFVVVPAYENSQPGHVQMLGARSCISNSGPVDATIHCNDVVTDKSGTGEQQLADALRSIGGAFQINHPSDGNWNSAFGHAIIPDTVEVWNIGPWAWQHPFPASNDNDYSLGWYDEFLQAGNEVAMTGGSDSHWVTTDAAQGVGEPTTWVYVQQRTVQGVIDGLRAHRTFVSALPPALNGPQLYLEAAPSGTTGFTAVAGSEVAPGALYRARVANAAVGSLLRVVTDHGEAQVRVGPSNQVTFRPGQNGFPAADKFVRVELQRYDAPNIRVQACDAAVSQLGGTQCHNKVVMLALSSPIYVR